MIDRHGVFVIVYDSRSTVPIVQVGSVLPDEIMLQAGDGKRVMALAFDHDTGKPVLVEPDVLLAELAQADAAELENEKHKRTGSL